MKYSLIIALMSMMTQPVMADFTLPQRKLIVVEDKGGSSTEPYFRALGLLGETEQIPADTNNKQIRAVKDTDMLPIRSTSLSPGAVSSRQIEAFGLTPLFLVGDDPVSKRWLVINKDKLIQLKATGMVVNVETAQGLVELKKMVPELILSPISGDDIAKRLGLKNYPIFITSSAIEQ